MEVVSKMLIRVIMVSRPFVSKGIMEQSPGRLAEHLYTAPPCKNQNENDVDGDIDVDTDDGDGAGGDHVPCVRLVGACLPRELQQAACKSPSSFSFLMASNHHCNHYNFLWHQIVTFPRRHMEW